MDDAGDIMDDAGDIMDGLEDMQEDSTTPEVPVPVIIEIQYD